MKNGIVIDVETTGFSPIRDRLLCVGCEHPNGIKVYTVPERVFDDSTLGITNDNRISLFIGANIQFDLQWFIGDREIPKCKTHDVQFMHYLLDENYPIRNLKHLHLLYTDLEDYEPDVLPYELSPEDLYKYNAKDVYSTRLVYEGILRELEDEGINYKPTLELISGIQPILAGMERTGMPIDERVLQEVADAECTGVAEAETEIRTFLEEYGKGELNLNSHRQLSEFIFRTLGTGIPDVQGARNKDGTISTSKEILSECDDRTGFISQLLSYKTQRDNYRKYVLNLQEHCRSGRVHPSYNIYKTNYGGTSTGRLSVNNPPIHNIPRGHNIRRAFVPFEREGYLVQMDLSQIELVMLAYLSQDPELIGALENNEDLHMWVVNELANEGISLQRQEAKTVNYSILYGGTPYGIYSQTGLSLPAAEYIHKRWFERFSGVKQYQLGIESATATNGFVESPYGRRRYFPHIDYDYIKFARRKQSSPTKFWPKKEYWTHEAWLREAKNFVQQSIASDLNLIILRETAKELQGDIFPLTIIHDSVLWSVDDRDSLDSWNTYLQDYFANDYLHDIKSLLGMDINVDLKAEVKYGKNWLELGDEFEISTTIK